MKELFVGDIHAKYHILEQVKRLSKDYDKVVFLGDYVDDWNTVPEGSYNLVNSLVKFKLDNPRKVKLLLGNHDLSEWFGRPFACSGYNPLTSRLVQPLFETSEQLFDIAYAPNPHLICSHAGFTTSWVKRVLKKKYRSAISMAKDINIAFHNRFNFSNPEQEKYQWMFFHLADVGHNRGGWKDPSPIWADEIELAVDWYPLLQIVGHTSQKTVKFYNSYDKEIYFCDTFSTYPTGESYGDCSLLEIKDGTPSKISLDGKKLPW